MNACLEGVREGEQRRKGREIEGGGCEGGGAEEEREGDRRRRV